MTKPKSLGGATTKPIARLEQRLANIRRHHDESVPREAQAQEANITQNKELMESLQLKVATAQSRTKRPKRTGQTAVNGAASKRKKKKPEDKAPTDQNLPVANLLGQGPDAMQLDQFPMLDSTYSLLDYEILPDLGGDDIENVLGQPTNDPFATSSRGILVEPQFPPIDQFELPMTHPASGYGNPTNSGYTTWEQQARYSGYPVSQVNTTVMGGMQQAYGHSSHMQPVNNMQQGGEMARYQGVLQQQMSATNNYGHQQAQTLHYPTYGQVQSGNGNYSVQHHHPTHQQHYASPPGPAMRYQPMRQSCTDPHCQQSHMQVSQPVQLQQKQPITTSTTSAFTLPGMDTRWHQRPAESYPLPSAATTAGTIMGRNSSPADLNAVYRTNQPQAAQTQQYVAESGYMAANVGSYPPTKNEPNVATMYATTPNYYTGQQMQQLRQSQPSLQQFTQYMMAGPGGQQMYTTQQGHPQMQQQQQPVPRPAMNQLMNYPGGVPYPQTRPQ